MSPEECSVRAALGVIGGKWKPVIARYLMLGTKRFGELRKSMPDATQKMLTQQLREMERDGIVARKVYHQVPPKVEYSLTAYNGSAGAYSLRIALVWWPIAVGLAFTYFAFVIRHYLGKVRPAEEP